jgi:hypothetical protein
MPVKTIRVSSLSNEIIPEGTGARVRIMFTDPNRVDMRADLTDEEAESLAKTYAAEQVDPRPARRGERRIRI